MPYDPFTRGPVPVGVRTIEALDEVRGRRFSIEIWYPAAGQYAGQDLAQSTQDVFAAPGGAARSQPAVRDAAAQPGDHPLILYSHHSGGHRRAATFVCTHLSSHGYVVAALDHSEVVAPELGRRDGETPGQAAARADAVVASRVPDLRFLLGQARGAASAGVNATRIGVVGHSLGGWTVLAAAGEEPRIEAVVALAPGGNSNPRPGILRMPLRFAWEREVPTLYLVADQDVPLPLDGMYELFGRTPAPKQMFILRRADHLHFVDHVEEMHEMARAMKFSEELAYLQKEMRPIAELCSGDEAHRFVRGLALCHFDAALKQQPEARSLLADGIELELARKGVAAARHTA